MATRILLVEDEHNMARTLAKNLERAGHEVEHAPHGEAALARLGEARFDVVLTDLKMPVMDGMQLLRAMHEQESAPAVVVLTGYGTIESAVEAMKLGAADYLIKDARPQEILLTIERVLRLDALRRENAQLRRAVRKLHGFGELIGDSAAMHDVYRVVGAVSQNKSTVLVSGESGTGKELVARTIHGRGPVAGGPFIAINCAGLSETLLDSLSEIPLGLQAKFLRALQDREVTPLGSSRPIAVDVRLIAATNRDLEGEMRGGRFRSDLFYRLNVVHIALPPLRARGDDVGLLIDHFIQHFSREYQVAPKRVTAEAMARLRGYGWPGNIRELQNAIERAFALSGADTITLADLPPLRDDAVPASMVAADGAAARTLREEEERVIAAALRESGGNKNEAARLLGIDRQRLYRKIKKYRLA